MRGRALALLDGLTSQYEQTKTVSPSPGGPSAPDPKLGPFPDPWKDIQNTTRKRCETGIEGLSGWGPPPGVKYVFKGDLLVLGSFGNVFIGPQPLVVGL